MSFSTEQSCSNNGLTGYLHPGYAASLVEFGKPRQLPKSGAWILERVIPGFPYRDGMSCYPLFFCCDWSLLAVDLEGIKGELVSLAVVTDPFENYDIQSLRRCFKDLAVPFKDHFVVNLQAKPLSSISAHHRRNLRQAQANVSIEADEGANLHQHLDNWNGLYAVLIQRHQIHGIRAFSRLAFLKQLSIPGLTIFRAGYLGRTVGMILCFRQGQIAYYHLGAYDEVGYKLKASYALIGAAIEYYAARGLHWFNLGAGAGIKNRETDGLTRFKRGWATGIRTSYFCGRIFDREKYVEISQAKNLTATDYFPTYRKDEF